MNFNPPNNLKDLVISTFQEILAEDPNFFFTDELSILTWKSKKITGALITKVGNRRYLGFLRKDRQGQDYWKYKPLKNSASEESDSESSAVQPNSSDSLTKYQRRIAKTQELNHGKSTNSE
jgi:hypothetical protein